MSKNFRKYHLTGDFQPFAFHPRWKIRQVTQVIENELAAYQRVIDATL